jgi:hypothetical protein
VRGTTRGAEITIYARIHPTVAKDDAKYYGGPDAVIASVVRNADYPNSRIRLSGLTVVPKSVEIGHKVTRAADHDCMVTGLAKSRFTLDSKEGAAKWKPT